MRGKSAVDLSRELLERFGSLGALLGDQFAADLRLGQGGPVFDTCVGDQMNPVAVAAEGARFR